MLKALGLSLLCVLASASLTVLGVVFLNSAWHTVPSAPAAIFTVLGFALVVLSVLAWIWTIQLLCNSRWCMKDYLAKQWLKGFESRQWLKDFETGAAMGMDAQHTPPDEQSPFDVALHNTRTAAERDEAIEEYQEDVISNEAEGMCQTCGDRGTRLIIVEGLGHSYEPCPDCDKCDDADPEYV
jgi:hypothetical protein